MLKNDKDTLNWQRRWLARLGFSLPILAPLAGLPAIDKNGPEFWYSISATFYATSGVLMVMTLGIFGAFMFTYPGYDKGDRRTSVFSALMAIGIVLFPCECAASPERVGIFDLPAHVSHIYHCIIAALLFASFAYMIGFRFTKTDKKYMSTYKIARNKIYHACAIIIAAAMGLQVITSVFGISWMTIVNEAIMLWSFSFAWAVKSGMFKKIVKKIASK